MRKTAQRAAARRNAPPAPAPLSVVILAAGEGKRDSVGSGYAAVFMSPGDQDIVPSRKSSTQIFTTSASNCVPAPAWIISRALAMPIAGR